MNRNPTIQINKVISPTVKWLIIINVVVWLFIEIILDYKLGVFPIRSYFALFPGKVIFDFQIWQLATYMFLHAISPSHLLFNMLMLWWLGTELELRWGRKYFLFFYLLSGIGAAIFYCVGTLTYAKLVLGGGVMGPLRVPVLGASGAIFGLLVAYGILFGERTIYFMMMFPMKAKYLVMMMGAVEMVSLLTGDSGGGEVAYLCHLGGLLSGYLILIFTVRYERFKWNLRKKKQAKLRLVVDNQDPKTGDGPKYWN